MTAVSATWSLALVQSPETMWLIYGFIACLSPIALIAARRWLLSGVPGGVPDGKKEEAAA